MSTPAAPRILFCGDVVGRFNQLFKRFHTVNKASGPFDALLCVGQFFPDSSDELGEMMEYLEGRSSIPIPIYFTGDYGAGAVQILHKALQVPSNQGFKMDGIRICNNLFCLKGSGKFILRGLSVAYLSGKSCGQAVGMYTEDDVGALRALVEESEIFDIFLSNEWPTGVWKRVDISSLPQGISDPLGCDSVIAELVSEIKPRYHVAGTKGTYFLREPYANVKAVHTTRFIGLASVGNKNKQKFIYAVSPAPASTMSPAEISAQSPNTTLSPYVSDGGNSNSKEMTKRSSTADGSQYWRFDVPQKRQKQSDIDSKKLCFKYLSSGSCQHENKCPFQHDEDARVQYQRNVCFDFLNKGKCERGPGCNFRHSLCEEGENIPEKRNRHSTEKKCWFCLSSSSVESHLLISVGESYYCALAKGPLVQNHVLLIPIDHCPNTLSMAPQVETELEQYQSALKLYFKNQGKVVVFYEWVSQRTSHANLQVIPVPVSKEADIGRVFTMAAKRLGFEFEAFPRSIDYSCTRAQLRSSFDETVSYFYVQIPNGETLMLSVKEQQNRNFPVQFGREVLAGMLNMADRADWRNCQLNEEEETKMVESFKVGFAEFDPTTVN